MGDFVYSKIVGKKVKILYRDGDKSSIIHCAEVLEYDSELTTLSVFDLNLQRQIFINATDINKLEVLP